MASQYKQLQILSSLLKNVHHLGQSACIRGDNQGNLLSMTIEHARTNARLNEFSYQEMGLSQDEGRTVP